MSQRFQTIRPMEFFSSQVKMQSLQLNLPKYVNLISSLRIIMDNEEYNI